MSERPLAAPLAGSSRPRLSRGVRLQHSAAHGGDVLLGPERVFKADAVAAAVLSRCTGAMTLDEMVDDLARTYAADPERVRADVTALLRGLAEKRMLEW